MGAIGSPELRDEVYASERKQTIVDGSFLEGQKVLRIGKI